jgi:ectoine hydroxylase-related dioxygenase (phytanoyl-CoA dioxygenase family)
MRWSLRPTLSPDSPAVLADLERDGFGTARAVLSTAEVTALAVALEALPDAEGVRARGEAVYAVRNLFEAVPAIRSLAAHPGIRSLVEPVLGAEAFPVRALLFDKRPGANWKVPWHQDLAIAVRERREVPGFGPWSVKAGVLHVQPPAEVLERMVTVRLHLDACGPEHGPLLVLPGSHRHGRLPAEQIRSWRESTEPVTCLAESGDALLMRPLMLHASGAATRPEMRRVVHLEFATEALPGGLEWVR